MFIQDDEKLEFSLFLFQCLFEAQTMEHFSATLKSLSGRAIANARSSTSLDTYALGYCIATFPMGVSWDVTLEGNVHHSFTCGLQTNTTSVGVIERMYILNCPVRLTELKSNPIYQVNGILLLNCQLTNADMVLLSELIQQLTCLSLLSIPYNHATDGEQEGLLNVLHQLCHSNVTHLDIANVGLGELLNSPHDYSSAIKRLIDPSSGKLEFLGVGENDDSSVDNALVDLLSAPSSLKDLHLRTSCLSLHVEHLKNNTQLRMLVLHHFDMIPQVPYLVDIISHNKTICDVAVIKCLLTEQNIDTVRPLVNAIHGNRTLERIELHIKGFGDSNEAVSDYMTTHHRDLTLDSRITWKHWLLL